MGIRQIINENQGVVAGITVLIMVAAVVIIYRSSTAGPLIESGQVFYTIDDGQTYFREAINLHPPFEHKGAEAVRAFVFTCDGEGQGEGKVAFLMKYSPEGRQRLIEAADKPGGDFTDALDGMPPQYVLYKKPGGAEWIPSSDRRVAEIRRPECPAGQKPRALLATQ